MKPAPLDIVYTWVDDTFPGFQSELRRYAEGLHDLSPNRTRDNLALLKYSLRSIERFAPWRGTIFIVSPRPQVPPWLRTDHPGVRLVHLDEFMPSALIPCFNAFAIESYVHALPLLSERYVHFNDDMLLFAPVERNTLESEDGRLHYYFVGDLPASTRRITAKMTPHDAGMINTARALDHEFGYKPHPRQAHHPRIIAKSDMDLIIARYGVEFARTRAARFRAQDTILPHMLLAPYLVETRRAVFHGKRETDRLMRYVGLEDYALWNRWLLGRAERARRPFLALNDNFGVRPNRNAEAVVRRFLERHFPEKSAFER